jgi:hypothetical protein
MKTIHVTKIIKEPRKRMSRIVFWTKATEAAFWTIIITSALICLFKII